MISICSETLVKLEVEVLSSLSKVLTKWILMMETSERIALITSSVIR